MLQQETPDTYAFGYITEDVKSAGEYATDISENAINYLMEEKQSKKI